MLAEYYMYEDCVDYQLDEVIDGGNHCPGCIFLNSRSIASQWLDNPDSYSPKLLPNKHFAAQCQMKDIVMDLIFQNNLNLKFYDEKDYLYAGYPIPKIPCEQVFGT